MPAQLVDEPLPLARVRRRKGIDARSRDAGGARIALGRFWVRQGMSPVLTRDETHPNAFTIEVPFGALEAPRTRLRGEALSARASQELDQADAHAGLGWMPDHLDVTFAAPTTGRASTKLRAPATRRYNGVFPPDDRKLLQNRSYPWCTVGRVDTPGGGGTGTMVGRRLMLMASHSAVRRDRQLQSIEFTPAYFDGPNTFGAAWAERLIYWKDIDGSGQITDDQTAFDYAIAVFELPIGLLTGYVGYRTYNPAWNNLHVLEHVGYPSDLATFTRPYLTQGTFHSADAHTFKGQTGYVLGHVIDTAPGHSGGPFWAWFDGEHFPRVVAVDSTGVTFPRPSTSGDNEAGGGPALSALINYARQKYP